MDGCGASGARCSCWRRWPRVVALPAGALGATKHAPKAPSGLAFYSPPARLLAGTPGTVIWSRTIATPHALTSAARTTLVLYRSVLPNGKPTAVSGLVFTPRGHAPKHGWKLIDWAHGTTGIADICAPSRAAGTSYVYPQFNGWLKAGYAIAQTDYQGLGTPGTHLYLIGHAEGRSVVDAALAARHLYPSIGRRYVIAGHSQGGQSALFAAAESAHDAPGLAFAGVAAFAPASHLKTQVQAAGGADQARRWTERARRADPDGCGRRVAGGRPARAAHAGGVRAGPGGPARVHGGAVGSRTRGVGSRRLRSSARAPTRPRCTACSTARTRR